jgi:hypothetical protein
MRVFRVFPGEQSVRLVAERQCFSAT